MGIRSRQGNCREVTKLVQGLGQCQADRGTNTLRKMISEMF